jgi:Prolyl oligopeptidase family
VTEPAGAGSDWSTDPGRTMLALVGTGSAGASCRALTPSGRADGSPLWTLDPGEAGWRLLGWAAPRLLALWRRDGDRSVLRIEDVTDPDASPTLHRLLGRPVACAVTGDRTEVLLALARGGRTVPCLYRATGDSYMLIDGAGDTGAWDARARLVAVHGEDGVAFVRYDEHGRSAWEIEWPDGVTAVASVGGNAEAVGLTGLDTRDRAVPGLLHGPSGGVRWLPEHAGYTCAEIAPSGGALLLTAWDGEQYRYRVVDPVGRLLAEPRPTAGLTTDLRFTADEAHLLGWHQSPARAPQLITWDIHSGRTEAAWESAGPPVVPMTWAHRWFVDAGEPLPEWRFEPRPGPALGTVLYLHGGPRTRLNQAYDPVIAALVRDGWSVVGMNYPGSSGYGAEYRERTRGDWGGEDAAAVIRRIRALHAGSDGSPVCLYGHSYGGYLALLVAAEIAPLLDGVAVWAPITDLSLLAESVSGVQQRWLAAELGDRGTDASWLHARSPVYRLVELADVRLLVGHGADDERCPVGQSRRLAAGMSAAHRYLEDPAGAHAPSRWRWWADEVATHYRWSVSAREPAAARGSTR